MCEALAADVTVACDNPSMLQLMCFESVLHPEHLPTGAAFELGLSMCFNMTGQDSLVWRGEVALLTLDWFSMHISDVVGQG